jgi:hypothetical protein
MGSTTFVGVTPTWYYGEVKGLRSWGGVSTRDGDKHTRLLDDYWGEFETANYGVASPILAAKGFVTFHGIPDETVYGASYYSSNGLALSIPFGDAGIIYTRYEEGDTAYRERYFTLNPDGRGKSVDPELVYADLKRGMPGFDMNDLKLFGSMFIRKTFGYGLVNKYARVYNGINHDSYR